ncbi:Transcriptional regulator, ArsR family [Halorhabdus sp. SVX81]|uniref:RNA polymerase subunit sigma-70 n=1 Tax=Halorhabdus sp. SVX81 TaxID=2978283 RepID=UPI0023DA56F9|nr:RNA polymerase subunit sigma-70 [Halorhabdus sp. SVX81]WEL18884.1 Transcriptional regulator, ArsR family [Halorhabdus sp. SVX81]
MYTACGEKALKTLLAIDPGDTIVGVARKIDENRETIRRTVDRLEAEGYIAYDDGLTVVDESVREAGLQLLAASAGVSPPSISEAYVLPQFAGMDFAFTGIDAVYVWTRGGYQVAREPDDYPLFIAVEEPDLEAWERFFERFNIPVSRERQPRDEINGPLQVVVEPRDAIDADSVDGRPVITLDETVAFAREHYATFQSALSMLDRMYDEVDSDANYRMEPA